MAYVLELEDENTGQGTLTVEAVYKGVAWVGIGFSETGAMAPSVAVVALPDEPVSDVNPSKYHLQSHFFSGVIRQDTPALSNTNIFQNETHTILSFTTPLLVEGEYPILANGVNKIIHAIGYDNGFGLHGERGRTLVEFTPCAKQDNVSPEAADNVSPEAAEEEPDTSNPAGNDNQIADPLPEVYETLQPVEENPDIVEPVGDNPDTVEPVEDNHDSLEPAEGAHDASEPVEENQDLVEPVEEDQETSGPIEENPDTLEPPEGGHEISEPVEKDPDTLHPAEENHGTLDPAEGALDTLKPIEEDQDKVELIEDNPETLEPSEGAQEISDPINEDQDTLDPDTLEPVEGVQDAPETLGGENDTLEPLDDEHITEDPLDDEHEILNPDKNNTSTSDRTVSTPDEDTALDCSGLREFLQLSPWLTIEFVVNLFDSKDASDFPEGIFSARITYNGLGWVGFGIISRIGEYGSKRIHHWASGRTTGSQQPRKVCDIQS